MVKITNTELRKRARAAIRELLVFFEKNPECFKSESDVKCYLYHLLLKKIPYRIKSRFENNKRFPNKRYSELLIVTELNTNKRYKKRDSSRKMPKKYDMAILDPSCIENELLPLVAIEIKFNSRRSLKKSKVAKGVRKDLNKLNRTRNKVSEGHLIIIDNRKYSKQFEDLYSELKHYFDRSRKLKEHLWLWIRHVDFETGEVKYRC